MESGAQAEEPPHQRAANRLASVVGTAIAFITLVMPIYTIAQYSSNDARNVQLLPSQLNRRPVNPLLNP